MSENLRWRLWICTGVLFICGCGHSGMFEIKKTSIDENKGSLIAGTWKTKDVLWAITFDNDGTLKKIKHNTSVEFVVAEGGTTLYGPNNKDALFILGPCNVEYKGDNLNVTVNIDYYKMELPQGTLEGRIKDTLLGKLSKDKSVWNVKWYCYSWLKGAVDPPVGEINSHPAELVFYKMKNEPNSVTN